MNFAKLMACTGLMALSGCSVLEGLGRGLGNLAGELEGQPVIYAGVSIEGLANPAESRHFVSAVTVVVEREGSPDSVFYEGLRRGRPVVDFVSATWPGRFRSLSLRSDNRRIAGVLEENIIDTDEYWAFISSVPEGRTIKRVTDEIIARDAFELCFDPEQLAEEVDRFVVRNNMDDKFPDFVPMNYEVEYDYLFSGGPLQEWVVEFHGWTRAGRPVFSADYHVTIRISGPDIIGREMLVDLFDITPVQPSTRVVYSASTGERIACFDNQNLVPEPERQFAVGTRQVRSARDPSIIGTRLTITPPTGGDFPLFAFPTSEVSQSLLTYLGEIDVVATPAVP